MSWCHTLWPQGARRTHIVCEWLFDPDAIARPDFDPSGAVEFLGHDQPAGLARLRVIPTGAGVAGLYPGPYSAAESLPAAFDREVLRALGQNS